MRNPHHYTSPAPSTIASHPAHLQPGSASALIPFCGFAGELSRLGARLEDSSLLQCDKFSPVILEGELCYQLNVTSHLSKPISFGPAQGLLLILDQNPELSVGVEPEDKMDARSERLDTGTVNRERSARVYIHTLAGHWSLKPGLHSLTSVKEVTGTPSFMALTQLQRGGCQAEEREGCQTQVTRQRRLLYVV